MRSRLASGAFWSLFVAAFAALLISSGLPDGWLLPARAQDGWGFGSAQGGRNGFAPAQGNDAAPAPEPEPWTPLDATGAVAVWDAGADSFPTYGVKGGYDLDGSTQYFDRTSGAIPGVSGGAPSYPLSVVCWFKPDVTNATQFVWSIDDGSATNRLILYATASAQLRAYANDSGGASYAQSAAALTAGRWHCAIAVFASASSRAIYVDTDTTGATETTSRSPGSLSAMRVVSAHDASAKVNGVIAYTAILPVDLSGAGQASNRSAIFAGADPEVVTSTTATALYHFDNDNGADAKGSFDLTASGSPTAQNNLIVMRDKSGGGYHLRATTSAPTWSSTAFSNRGGASFASASSQFLVCESTPVTAAPFQVYGVATTTDAAASQNVVWIGDKDAADQFWGLEFRGSVANDPVGFFAQAGATTAEAQTSSGYSTSTTHLLWGLEASSTSRAARIDGASEGTNTTSAAPTGADRIALGFRADTSPNAYLGGTFGAGALLNTDSVAERSDFHAYYETEFGLTLP